MELISKTPRTQEITTAASPQPELGQRQLGHHPRPAHAAGRSVLGELRRQTEAQALDAAYGTRGESFDDYVARLHRHPQYQPDPVHDHPLYLNANTPRDKDLSDDTRERLATVATQPPKYEIEGRRVGDVTPGDGLNKRFPVGGHVTQYVLSLVKD